VNTPFRIGALRDLYTQPLYRTLKSSAEAELLFDAPFIHMERLMSNEINAAFIHPIDYAINSSDLIIFPGVGVSASGFASTVRLYMRGELHAIKAIAVGSVTTTDVVLTRIVLTEKYNSLPSIVPVAGTIEEMLAKADGALVAGDVVLAVQSDRPYIDIVDEWSDISELPFVHSFCAARSESFNKELSDLLITSQSAGKKVLRTLADELSGDHHQSPDTIYNFLSHFSYDFDDSSRESLELFFKMAYYHGMLGDVPEINVGG
jgi:predicted solute-binding protein